MSSLLLLARSLLTTSEDLFGNTIHCNLDVENIELDLFESYCFMANTFTLGPAKEDDGSLHLHHKSIGEGLGREDKRNTSQVTYSNDVPLPILYTDLTGLYSSLLGQKLVYKKKFGLRDKGPKSNLHSNTHAL